ncbi:hypothetical protein B0H16DRAFT_1305838 [Mycena metata]|uniref:Uncharacterized protein n=1 Tax=Mycena metata TaxID=1033252 RepID=A0AAD7JU19_9AGAR|nr:hypothetical protein B0H16DRAFT_1305838 [Mycena metata]
MNFLARSFLPVYASETSEPQSVALGDNGDSMIIGGAIMYLNPGETWPTCATCNHPLVPLIQINVSSERTPETFRALIPSVVPVGGSLATMVQLFVCPQFDCYDTSITYSTDTRSWLLRVATVPIAFPSDEPQLVEARAKIEQGPGFLPAHLVETWVAGKEETLHEALDWGQDDSEEFYAAHEPEPGLKLLGRSTRGKYYCSTDHCPRGGPHHAHPSSRELIQLGDRFTCEWEELDAFLGTLGNSWIEQCVEHPEVLTLSMSGDW